MYSHLSRAFLTNSPTNPQRRINQNWEITSQAIISSAKRNIPFKQIFTTDSIPQLPLQLRQLRNQVDKLSYLLMKLNPKKYINSDQSPEEDLPPLLVSLNATLWSHKTLSFLNKFSSILPNNPVWPIMLTFDTLARTQNL